MNRKKIAPFVLLSLALGSAAYAWWDRGQVDARPLQLFGNVDIREVDMSFRQPGRILRLAVDEGSQVKAGDPLAELDAKTLRDALAAALANRGMALAELEKLRRGSRRQEIAQAREAVHQVEAVVAETERQYRRQAELLDSGAISERAMESARSARDQAQAALGSARAGLSLKLEGTRREDVAVAQARFALAEAQVAQAETALADARLLAPADGLVSARVREAGSMVGAGQTVLTLSLQDPVYVRAYASAAQLTQLQPGRAVRVKADGSDKTFSGTVGFIASKAEFTPKSVETTELRTELVYRLRIAVPGAAQVLRQGMPVTVELAEPAAKS